VNILASLAKFGSRKFLLATIGNIVLGLFAKWILGKAEQLGATITWAGIVACLALAVGLWVYIVIEGRKDLEVVRLRDPYYRGERLLRLYLEAQKSGLSPDIALRLLDYAALGRGGGGCNKDTQAQGNG